MSFGLARGCGTTVYLSIGLARGCGTVVVDTFLPGMGPDSLDSAVFRRYSCISSGGGLHTSTPYTLFMLGNSDSKETRPPVLSPDRLFRSDRDGSESELSESLWSESSSVLVVELVELPATDGFFIERFVLLLDISSLFLPSRTRALE